MNEGGKLAKFRGTDKGLLGRLVIKEQLVTRPLPQALLIELVGVAIKITPCQYYRHAL